jgi:hypothetical protein
MKCQPNLLNFFFPFPPSLSPAGGGAGGGNFKTYFLDSPVIRHTPGKESGMTSGGF